MYAQDYDEVLPYATFYVSGTVTNYAGWNVGYYLWPDLIMSYIKNRQVFLCPSTSQDWIGYGYVVQLGYFNSNYFWPGQYTDRTQPMYVGVSLSQLAWPSITAMLCDHEGGTFNPSNWWTACYINPYSLTRNGPSMAHNSGLNIAFADGHVKWYNPPFAQDTSSGGPFIWTGCTYNGGC